MYHQSAHSSVDKTTESESKGWRIKSHLGQRFILKFNWPENKGWKCQWMHVFSEQIAHDVGELTPNSSGWWFESNKKHSCILMPKKLSALLHFSWSSACKGNIWESCRRSNCPILLKSGIVSLESKSIPAIEPITFFVFSWFLDRSRFYVVPLCLTVINE